jgi:hypothetical protein
MSFNQMVLPLRCAPVGGLVLKKDHGCVKGSEHVRNKPFCSLRVRDVFVAQLRR